MARGLKNQVSRRKPIDLTGILSEMDKDQLVALVGSVTDKMATELCASFSPPVGAVAPTEAGNKDESQPQNVESARSQLPAGRSNKNNDPGAKENIMPSSGAGSSSSPAMVANPTSSRSQPKPGPAVGQGGNRGEATEQMTSPLGVLKRDSLEIFTKWQATVMARVGDIFTKPLQLEAGPPLRGGGGRGRGAGSMRGDGAGRGSGSGRGGGGRGGRGVSGPQDLIRDRGGHWGNGRGGAQPAQALAVSHAGIGPCRPPPISQVDPALRIRCPPTGTSLWQRPIDKRRLILHVMTLLLMSLEEYSAYSRILLLNLTSSLLLPLQALHDEEIKMAQAFDRALGVLPLPPDDPTPANPSAKPEQHLEHNRPENINGQIDKQNGPEGEKKTETSVEKPVDMLAEQLAEKLAMSKKNPDEQNKHKTPDEQKDQTPAEPKEAGIPDEHKTPRLPHGQNDPGEQKPAAVQDPAGRGNKAGRESKCINPRKVKASNAVANVAATINTLLGPLMAAGLGTVPGEARLTKPMVTNLLGTAIESAPALGAFFGMLGGIGPNGMKPIAKSMEQFGKDVQDFALVPLDAEIRQITSSYTSARPVPAEHRRMRFVIAVGGWVADESDLLSPWRCLGRQAETFCVKWELASLMNLGNALHVIMQSSAWGLVKGDIIARTTIASLAQAHWPLSLLQISKLIENPWNVAMVRADKTGLILAETIIRRIPGGRPVSLVGYSLGARSIYTCLMTLAERRQLGLVDSVVLIGTPAPAESRVWLTMKSAVAGRLVNVYCESDYLLAFVYRAFNIEFGLAGIQPVLAVDGVENHNVGNLPSGHVRYHHMVGPILRDIGWEDLDPDQTVRDMELLAQADAKFEAETRRRQADAKLIVATDGTVTVDMGREMEEMEKEIVHKNNTASASNSNSNANSGGRKKKKRGQGNGKFKIPN